MRKKLQEMQTVMQGHLQNEAAEPAGVAGDPDPNQRQPVRAWPVHNQGSGIIVFLNLNYRGVLQAIVVN